jgi:hypothetical protein
MGEIGSTITIADYREVDSANDYKARQIDGVFTNNGVFGTGMITDVAYFMDSNDNTLTSAMIQIPGALPGKTSRFSTYATGVGCKDFASIIIAGERYTLPPKVLSLAASKSRQPARPSTDGKGTMPVFTSAKVLATHGLKRSLQVAVIHSAMLS